MIVSLSLESIFWISLSFLLYWSSSVSLSSRIVSRVTSGPDSDFESDIKSSYPSRTSEKSELDTVGLCPGMFCVPGVVAARDARLALGALFRNSGQQEILQGKRGAASWSSKTSRQRDKELS